MDVGRMSFQQRQVCRFYLQDRCMFGSRCRNLHIPKEQGSSGNGNHRNRIHPRSNIISTNSSSSSNNIRNSVNNTNNSRTEPVVVCTFNTVRPNGTPSKTVDQPEQAASSSSGAHGPNKSCGICLDEISGRKQRAFGILPNCNHCFCFSCISKWRKSKEFDLDVRQSCPECRVASDFVYSSPVWLEVKEEKEQFISIRRQKMARIDCRYYRRGRGRCPFGNTCLYRHAGPDGKQVDVGPPSPRRNRSHVDEIEHFASYFMIQALADDSDDMDIGYYGIDFGLDDGDDDDEEDYDFDDFNYFYSSDEETFEPNELYIY